MRPQQIADIQERADQFLKEKKNITNLKPTSTPQ